MAPIKDPESLLEEIDRLLEHYLELLDQHTKLRSQLSTVQSSVHQHLARANFTAERGVRYGLDFYDERMQATRVCGITVPSLDGDTSTAVGTRQELHAEGGDTLDDVERDTAAEGGGLKGYTTSTAAGPVSGQGETLRPRGVGTACFTISTVLKKTQEKETTAAAESEATKTTPKDPLRMFGLLTPPSLRLAQTESIKTVEDVIPKLVSVDAEMKEVEIRIRRARKWKAKAEAQELKAVENAGEKGFEGAGKRQEIVV